MASTAAKLLVPLSTAALAGAIALGSGAEWTSRSETTIEVTGGDILHVIDDSVGLTVTSFKPGAVVSDTVRLTNTGDLDSVLSLSETGVTDGFMDTVPNPDVHWLQLKIVATSPELAGPVTVYDAPLGEMGALAEIDGLVLEAVDGAGADEYVDLTFTLRLPVNTPNAFQAAQTTATYQFVTTQTDAADVEPAIPDGNDDEAGVTGFGGGNQSSGDPAN